MRMIIALTIVVCISLCSRVEAKGFSEYPATGKQYEPIVIRFAENLGFENPFDIMTNQVELSIIQPDFTRKNLSFFYDDKNSKGIEKWEARFTPKQAGIHSFSIIISGKLKEKFSINVEVNKKKKQGGLTLSSKNGVFKYETGESFRGIGLNVCWAEDYEYYFKKLNANGINVARIWMCPWNLSFEWQETGLGKYSLETARRLDTILALAEQYGIFIVLCFDYHGIAPKGLGFFKEDRWLVNPYNIINGGFCKDRMELFTNPDAKKFKKKRYKYLISRYGYSKAIATWEFFNEADLTAGQSIPVNQWHIEMAEFVKSEDVHERLVSTSSTRRYVEKLVDAFKSQSIDYVRFHDYNMLDVAPHFTYLHEAALEYYNKPVVIGEFGIEYRGGDLTYKSDSQHVGLHNGIWSGFFNETPIIPMSWWWDNYIDLHNLWYQYAYLSRFSEKINFDVSNLKFKTLTSGYNKQTKQQVYCFVRSIYFGNNCALWLKNDEYKWWMVSEGRTPKQIEGLIQTVPELIPGKYEIQWYNPQEGKFFMTQQDIEVKEDGSLFLKVPTFSKDIACIIQSKTK